MLKFTPKSCFFMKNSLQNQFFFYRKSFRFRFSRRTRQHAVPDRRRERTERVRVKFLKRISDVKTQVSVRIRNHVFWTLNCLQITHKNQSISLLFQYFAFSCNVGPARSKSEKWWPTSLGTEFTYSVVVVFSDHVSFIFFSRRNSHQKRIPMFVPFIRNTFSIIIHCSKTKKKQNSDLEADPQETHDSAPPIQETANGDAAEEAKGGDKALGAWFNRWRKIWKIFRVLSEMRGDIFVLQP